jgi:hypothetical protein
MKLPPSLAPLAVATVTSPTPLRVATGAIAAKSPVGPTSPALAFCLLLRLPKMTTETKWALSVGGTLLVTLATMLTLTAMVFYQDGRQDGERECYVSQNY